MDKFVALKTVLEAQKELRVGSPRRSEAALLREIFVQVEEALAAGYSREVVYQALRESGGYSLLWGGFKMALQRIRGQRLRAGKASVPRATTSVRPAGAAESADEEAGPGVTSMREVVATSRAQAEEKFNQYSRQSKRLGVLKKES